MAGPTKDVPKNKSADQNYILNAMAEFTFALSSRVYVIRLLDDSNRTFIWSDSKCGGDDSFCEYPGSFREATLSLPPQAFRVVSFERIRARCGSSITLRSSHAHIKNREP